jgi:hypothetical protein
MKGAIKKVQAKIGFYIFAIVFSCTIVLLLMLSFHLPTISFWLRLPIHAFILPLGILFLIAFGLASSCALNED